jgi:hypothetical protein
MSEFKPGDKVMCTDAYDTNLTEGQIYTVASTGTWGGALGGGQIYFVVLDEMPGKFMSWRFQRVVL